MSAGRVEGPRFELRAAAMLLRSSSVCFVVATLIFFTFAAVQWHTLSGALSERFAGLRESFFWTVGIGSATTFILTAAVALAGSADRELAERLTRSRLELPVRVVWSVTHDWDIGAIFFADATGLLVVTPSRKGTTTVRGFRREQVRGIETGPAASIWEWLFLGEVVLLLVGDQVVRLGTWDAEGLATALRAWVAESPGPPGSEAVIRSG